MIFTISRAARYRDAKASRYRAKGSAGLFALGRCLKHWPNEPAICVLFRLGFRNRGRREMK